MNLSETISILCDEYIDERNDWYTWKINESMIPAGITLPEGNMYFKNIALKKALHQAWKKKTDPDKKGALIAYYIRDWGGIKSNSHETMEWYKTACPQSLIANGKKGIASWSKALVVHDPGTYAIFDARVSTSLNCLQIIYGTSKRILYPLLSSKNKTITAGQSKIKEIANRDRWGKANSYVFYRDYLELLEKAAAMSNIGISTVEMLLFAKAEEFVRKITDLNSGD